jgi:3-deoxy-D-manno-octulosonic-acid transferase
MQIIYSLSLTIVFIALLPYFAYQFLVNDKYLSNLRERLGLLPDSLKSDGRSTIWLHAVSVGEALTAHSLVKALHVRFPGHRLIISTTTATGQAVARAKMTEAGGFCYFPFDWKFSVRRALNTIDPQIVILMESELWLNCLSECRKRKIPVVVANGRISDRSFARSQKFGLFVRRLYNLVTRFEMQSRVDAVRAVKLGAPAERVNVSGNIKYDVGKAGESPKTTETANFLDKIFALSSTPLIIAGSTSDGEEEIILSVFQRLRNATGLEKTRLLIAPRHPERFDEVAHLLDSSRLKYARRSTSDLPNEDTRSVDAILLDSIGELAALYQFASVVFVGGSLVMKGGHNILEPALFSKPIVVGPHMENFREITNEFLRRDALIQLQQANRQELGDELKVALVELLNDRERAEELGENARRTVEENRGATARTIEAVAGLIESI